MKRLLGLLALALIFCSAPAWATTRYVDPAATCTGNYSIANHNCTGADGNSYTTIASGASATASGDTLKIRTGTYADHLRNRITGGTAGSPTIIQAYGSAGAYEVVTIRPASGNIVDLVADPYVTLQGLILDGVNQSVLGEYGITLASNSHHMTLEDVEIENCQNSGILTGSTASGGAGGVLRRVHSHHNGTRVLDHGIYLGSSSGAAGPDGWLIEDSEFNNNFGYGIQLYANPSNAIVRRNLVHDNTSGIVVTGQGHILERNIVYAHAGGKGIRADQYAGVSNITFRHNLVYGSGSDGLIIGASGKVATGVVVQNNILVGNSPNYTIDAGSAGGVTSTTNKTTGTITDCTVSTTDFTHKAGSSCINAGTDIGQAFNTGTGKTKPDQGPFETLMFSSCVVENGDASTIRVTFTNNVEPPLLPSTGITTFTSRLATVANVVTAAVRTGDTRVDLTVTTPVVFAAAVDISWASGNLTDSALIGNVTNQPYRQTLTNQSCTNNVGAAATHVFTQAAFRFHGLRGTEAAPVGTPYATAPESANILVRVGGSVRLRIAVTCTTSDCPPTGFYPRYSKNAGGYTTVVPDVFAADNIGFCGTSPDPDIPTSGTASTNQLTPSGTFVAGAVVRTSNAIPTIDMANNGKTEVEYCFSFDSDATAGDTYDIRMYQQDGTALNAYTFSPRMTLAAPSAGMGF